MVNLPIASQIQIDAIRRMLVYMVRNEIIINEVNIDKYLQELEDGISNIRRKNMLST